MSDCRLGFRIAEQNPFNVVIGAVVGQLNWARFHLFTVAGSSRESRLMGVGGHQIHSWSMRYWCSFSTWPLRHCVIAAL